MKYIGKPIRRLEDPPLLRGTGRFAADISFPGQVHLRVVRSPVACGGLGAVETAAAQALDGVVAVWTARDVAEIPPIDFRQVRVPGLEPYRQPILARDRVRYVGEPVAAVFAEDPYLAEDAAELVFAEIDEARPCLCATAEPVEFAPGLSSEAAVIVKEYGDVAAAFAGAHAVVALELEIGRHSGTPIETRGAIARYHAGRGRLELFGAAKIPHINRQALAAMLSLPPGGIELFEGHVGGGFGIRGELYPEDVLVCLAALRLGRPVKWIEDRREHLIAANHSRGQVHRLRAAVDRRGVILALEDEFWHDQGAYLRTHAATVPELTAAMLPGPYRVPAYRASGRIRLTNKTPAGTYRAPGRYEGTFVREKLVAAVADRLGLDPLAVRRVNLIGRQEMPFDRRLQALGTPVVYDSGDYPRLLDRFLAHFAIERLEADLARRRQAGERVGFGLGFFVEKSGLGPFDGVRVTIEPSGRVEVVTGAASLGQGIETVIAQVCADALGVTPQQVTVIHGQTERIADGRGAFASRVTAMTGPAVHLAASRLKARVLQIAAGLLQSPAEALQLAEGRIGLAGAAPGPSLALADAAREAEAGLSEEEWFRADHMNYPYGIQGASVRIDAETGAVAVERLMIAYDIGRAVNPMLVEGQLAGGAAQGVGGALYEEFLYDAEGQPLSATFADYLMPTLAEMPSVEVLICEDAPSPVNPLGVKGAGEGGITAVGAAIALAIDAALGRPGAVTRLPVTPAWVRQAIVGRE